MATTKNSAVARTIRVLAGIIAFAVLSQAVRFFLGNASAPGLDLFLGALQGAPGRPSTPTADAGPSVWLVAACYCLIGAGVWLFLGILVVGFCNATARIVEVGFTQFMVECKAAQAERQRLVKLEGERLQRRELRRKRREAEQPKPSFSFGTLVLGIVIGKIL